MHRMAFLALAGCWSSAPPPPEPAKCPADQTGCAFEAEFLQGEIYQNPCWGACRDWAANDIDATVSYLCQLPPGKNEFVDGSLLVHTLLFRHGEPLETARLLRAVATNCDQTALERMAMKSARWLELRPHKDWTPVHQAAKDIIASQGTSKHLELLAQDAP